MTTETSTAGEAHNPEVHGQAEALPRGTILFVLAVTIAVATAASLATWWLFVRRSEGLGPVAPPPGGPPDREIADVPRELFSTAAPTPSPSPELGDVELGRYRWVDQARGLVAIPIDRAIEVVADGGATRPPPGGQGRRRTR